MRLMFLLAVMIMTATCIGEFIFRQDSIHCIANINYIRSSDTFSAIASHDMHDGQGVISLTGRLVDSEHNMISLSKIIRFTYHREGDLYLAKSIFIESSPDNQMSQYVQKKWLPDFFIDVGATLPFIIKKTGISTWAFYSGPVPLYLCEK